MPSYRGLFSSSPLHFQFQTPLFIPLIIVPSFDVFQGPIPLLLDVCAHSSDLATLIL